MVNDQIQLKISCWNIGSALQDLDKSFRLIAELITTHKPDIICFQEFPYCQEHIQSISAWGGFSDHIYHPCSPSHMADGWTMGLCIFSKYPLLDSQILPLTSPNCRIFYKGKEEFWHSKYFLKTSFYVGNTQIDLFTGHSFPFYRYGLDVENFNSIFHGIDSWIASLTNGLYLICADFNCRNAIDYMPFVSSTHKDIYAGVATRPTGLKTDAVIVPANTKCPICINQTVSLDHNFLFAELLLTVPV